MIFKFASGLFHIAADFTGKYAPYQAIQVGPHPAGGVLVCATDRGAAAFLGYDPAGRADETVCFLPDPELVKISNPIKTAERTLTINTNAQSASVTTHQKNADKTVETRAPSISTHEFPPLSQVMAACIRHWDGQSMTKTEELNAGRYDAKLLRQAIDAATCYGDAVVFSGFDGGPIRIEVEGSSLCMLVMPQVAVPLPGVPDWLRAIAVEQPAMVAA